MLALVWGIKRFQQYLLGNSFALITDHQPLTSILHPEKGLPSVTAARLHRYAVLLSGHSYDIRYRNTTSNANADALSRLPLVMEQPDEEIEDCGISTTLAGTASCDSGSIARSFLKGPSARKSYAVCTIRVAISGSGRDVEAIYGETT